MLDQGEFESRLERVEAAQTIEELEASVAGTRVVRKATTLLGDVIVEEERN
jgi:hypothetical protein